MEKDYIYSNVKLHYTVVSGNSDTPLVLIHGQCMCGLDYEKVIEKLSENYTLYLIDCFGHGESEKAPELYRCRIYAVKILPLLNIPLWIWIWTAIIAVTKIAGIMIASKKAYKLSIEHSFVNKLTGLLLYFLPLSICIVDVKYGATLVCAVATET